MADSGGAGASTTRSAVSSDPETIGRPRLHRSIKTILLATDLTAASDIAERAAIDLAAGLRARLLVVNVIGLGPPGAGSRSFRIDQQRARREASLMGIIGRARAHGVGDAAYLLWTGEPGDGIIAAAAAEGADLIVVGTRGLDEAGRFLLGSVSNHVVYHAGCAVLVAH